MNAVKLNSKQLQSLLHNSNIVLADSCGPKVLELEDKTFLKIFKLKSWYSSGLFRHHADRFIANSRKLKKNNIKTVDVITKYVLPDNYILNSKYTKAVQYRPIEGVTLRELIDTTYCDMDFIIDFARFIAKLHNLGIYFKAVHFANIIYNNNFPDKFGLIDIDNIKFYRAKLTGSVALKNIVKHMLRYETDKHWFASNMELFFEHYCEETNYSIRTMREKILYI